MDSNYCVYKIINLLNGRQYIGVHKHNGDPYNDNYMGSGKSLKLAQAMQGIEHFKKFIIYGFLTKQQAIYVQKVLVNKTYVSRPDTYNRTIGGCGIK